MDANTDTEQSKLPKSATENIIESKLINLRHTGRPTAAYKSITTVAYLSFNKFSSRLTSWHNMAAISLLTWCVFTFHFHYKVTDLGVRPSVLVLTTIV